MDISYYYLNRSIQLLSTSYLVSSFDSSGGVREVMITSLLHLYFDTNIPLEIHLLNGDEYAIDFEFPQLCCNKLVCIHTYGSTGVTYC